jgi:hypothetical protein
MDQVLHIFKKDARRHWPEILVSLIFLALFTHRELHLWAKEATAFSIGQFFLRSRYITPALLLFWSFLIVRVVQGESLVGDRQWWITKPYVWWKLLGAKILFIFVFIAVPLFHTQVFLLIEAHFPVLPNLRGILIFQASLFLVLFLPSLVLASLTKNMAQALLGVAIVFFSLLAGFWLMSKIPSSSSNMIPPLAEHIQSFLLLSCVTAAPAWQFARRKQWISFGTLLGIAALAFLIAVVTPYEKNLENYYPLVSAEAAPAQFTIRPFQEMQGRRRVWADAASEVNISIPLNLSGVSPGSVVTVDSMKVTADPSEDSHWSRGWYSRWAEIWPGDQRTELLYEVDRVKYEKVKTVPLHLYIELALSEFQEGDARELVVGRGIFHDEVLGTCRLNPMRDSEIQCLRPFHEPTYIIRFDSQNSTCAPQEDDEESPPSYVARAWHRALEEDFPDPNLNPIDDYSVWFSPSSLSYRSGSGAKATLRSVSLCPGAKLRFVNPVFKRQVRVKLDIPNVRLQDLVEAAWQ